MSAGRRHEPSSIALTAVLSTIATLATLLLLAPTVVVIVLSFTNGFSLKFPPPGYSLRWYESLPDAFQLQYAALNSLKVASAATLIAVVLGVAAARLDAQKIALELFGDLVEHEAWRLAWVAPSLPYSCPRS